MYSSVSFHIDLEVFISIIVYISVEDVWETPYDDTF